MGGGIPIAHLAAIFTKFVHELLSWHTRTARVGLRPQLDQFL
jgi:hypothetical protein